MKGFGENNLPPKNEIVPFKQSLELATKLYAEFEPAIRANLQKEVGGVRDGFKDYPNLIEHFLKLVPDDIAEKFVGHGITKTSGVIENPTIGQLAAVLNIMANQIVKGDWGAVRNSGYIDAYDSGPFLILSKKGKGLGLKRIPDSEGRYAGPNVDIGAVAVNAQFYPMIEKLRELFPNMNIIRANELPDYMKEEK